MDAMLLTVGCGVCLLLNKFEYGHTIIGSLLLTGALIALRRPIQPTNEARSFISTWLIAGLLFFSPFIAWGIIVAPVDIYHKYQHFSAMFGGVLVGITFLLETRGAFRDGATFLMVSALFAVMAFILLSHPGRHPWETQGHSLIAGSMVPTSVGFARLAMEPFVLWPGFIIILSIGMQGICLLAIGWVWTHSKNDHINMMILNAIIAAGSLAFCWIIVLRFCGNHVQQWGDLHHRERLQGEEVEPIGTTIGACAHAEGDWQAS